MDAQSYRLKRQDKFIKYLLQITRNTRAERPTESVIVADSGFADSNEWGSLSQDLAKDNFFILDADNSPLEIVLIKLLALDQLYSPAKILNNEGYAVILYPHSNKWTNATSLRPGSTAQVQWVAENTSGTEVYGTLAEAQVFIGSLNNSDGWVLIDEAPGTPTVNTTQVIYSSPTLWYANIDPLTPTAGPEAILLQQNFLGRTDSDRA